MVTVKIGKNKVVNLIIAFAMVVGTLMPTPLYADTVDSINVTLNIFGEASFEGTWGFHSLSTGGNWEGWHKGSITSDGQGNITARPLVDSAGNSTITSGTYSVVGTGLIDFSLVDATGNTTIKSGMNSKEDVVVGVEKTQTPEYGLDVMVKSSIQFVTGDFAGNWNLYALASGGTWEGWRRGTVSSDGNGNITGGSIVTCNGVSLNVTGGTYTLGQNGAFAGTVVTNGGPFRFGGSMNDSRDIIACVDDPVDAAPEMTVFVKSTATFDNVNMLGKWNVYMAASADTWEGYRSGILEFDDAGNVLSGSLTDHSGATLNVTSGSYIINANGTITASITTDDGDTLTVGGAMNDSLDLIFATATGTTTKYSLIGMTRINVTGVGVKNPSITLKDQGTGSTEYTTQPTVDVDLDVSGATEYILGEDAVFTGGVWTNATFPVTATHTFTDASLGTKTLYAKFRNASGEESATVSDNIIHGHPPVLDDIGDRTGTAWEWFTIGGIKATDADNQTLTMTAEPLEPGMRFIEMASSPGSIEYKLRWVDNSVIAGTYNVKFTVSDGQLTDSETVKITIASVGNRPPVLNAIGSRSGTIGNWFIIPRINARDPDGDDIDITMTSPDLPASVRYFRTTPTPNPTPGFMEYKLRWPPHLVQAGTYTVTFTASDGLLTDDETITITITDPALTCYIQASTTDGDAPLTVDFQAIANRALRRHWWNLDDGTTINDINAFTHTFELPSIYKVTLTVRDQQGDVVTANPVLITVRHPEYSVSIDASPETGMTPLDVDLNALLSQGWLPNVSWNYGDGNQGVGQNVSHLFSPPGDYTVTVEAQDVNATKQDSKTIRVFGTTPPVGIEERGLFVWDAWDSGDSDGWRAQGSLQGIDLIGDGNVHTGIGAGTSYMESKRLLIDSSQLDKVYIGYKATGVNNTTAKLAWKYTGDTSFQASREQTFTLIDDGNFHTYELDLSAHPEWKDHIIQLRFYPSVGTTGRVWVDFVRVRQGAVQSPGDIDWEFNPGGTGIVNDPVKRTELLDFCYIKGINTVLINSQGAVYGTPGDIAAYTAFINEAHARNIDVYGLQGRAWWSIPDTANFAGQVWTTQDGWLYTDAIINYGQFDGIIDDTEPYTVHSTSWTNNLNQRAQWFLDWAQGCKTRCDTTTTPFISTIPFWFDTINEALNGDANPRPLSEYVSDIASSVCIMDYRDFAEGANGLIEHANNEITYGPTWVAVEVNDLTGSPHADLISFYEEGEAYMEGELTKLRNHYSGNTNYLGTFIHFYRPYKYMKP